MFGNKARQAAG